MKKMLFYLFILWAGATTSQTRVSVDILKNSSITIHGSSNLLTFKLVHDGNKLPQKTLTLTATECNNRIYLNQNQLSIDVRNFNSDNKMALRDFRKLIKSDAHPTLLVELNHLETVSGKEQNQRFSKGKASVNITITGVTNQYQIPVSSNRMGEKITIDGSQRINIRDFGLEPPVEMLGLLKVSEWIKIEFQMVCKLVIKQDTLGLN